MCHRGSQTRPSVHGLKMPGMLCALLGAGGTLRAPRECCRFLTFCREAWSLRENSRNDGGAENIPVSFPLISGGALASSSASPLQLGTDCLWDALTTSGSALEPSKGSESSQQQTLLQGTHPPRLRCSAKGWRQSAN